MRFAGGPRSKECPVSADVNQLQRVKALSPADLRRRRIKKTAATKPVIEIMTEICEPDFQLLISEAELALLTDIYIRLREVKSFRTLHQLRHADPGVNVFFTLVKKVVTVEQPVDRANAWVAAYRAFDTCCGDWPATPWALAVLQFSRLELMLLYGMKVVGDSPAARYVWRQ